MEQKNYLKLSFVYFCLFIVVCFSFAGCALQKERYVVVLSMDGFRPDYITRANTPNIDSIISVGLNSELIPCFPTVTFPNHYSMATGLYPDNHGLVANTFFERETGRSFAIAKAGAADNPYFYGGEPVWHTLKKHGMQSACFFWVGSDVPVNGAYPDYWKRYDKKISYENRVDTVIHWLTLPKKERPNLLMLYFDEPDHSGHLYSPDSDKTLAMVERCDSALGYLLAEMRKLPHKNKIDFLLVSDHGMSTYKPELAVNLNDYLSRDSFDFVVTGAYCLLYPKDNYLDTAYKILQNVPRVKVYKKEELPERLHYGKNARVGDLVVIPDIGTYIYFSAKNMAKYGGAHGYDNKEAEMRAIFCAFGPSFEKGKKAEAFENILIYPLICRLLGVSPAKHDANESILNTLIKDFKSN